jgi:hypothetical protein
MIHDDKFPTTRWTLLERARAKGPAGQEALALLLDRYLPALGAYLLHSRKVSPDRVDDVLQSFVMQKLIEQQLLNRATRERGRFRSLLLKSLYNFLISESRYDHAQCRDSRKQSSLDSAGSLVDDEDGPARAYEVEWARALVAEAIRRLEAECQTHGKLAIWGVFEGRLLAAMLGSEPTSYHEIIDKYGLKSPMHAANLLTTAKRMYIRTLRTVVSEYEPDEERIEAEIAELRSILGGHS